MNTIYCLWEDIGKGNKQNRIATIQMLCESIAVVQTIIHDPYIFRYHHSDLLPSNPTTYYRAVEALNDNINIMNTSINSSQQQQQTQIYTLLHIISKELIEAFISKSSTPI